MNAEHDPSAVERSEASDVVDAIRGVLAQSDIDDLNKLLKISGELEALQESRLGADDAAAWRARAETRRERSRAVLARQGGFKLGLLIGFAAGFALSGLFGAMLALHYVVANQ